MPFCWVDVFPALLDFLWVDSIRPVSIERNLFLSGAPAMRGRVKRDPMLGATAARNYLGGGESRNEIQEAPPQGRVGMCSI
jgi:hypothetical protein